MFHRARLPVSSLLALLLPGVAFAVDSDGDFLEDDFETTYGYNPALPDTDGDGLLDWEEDGDGDGLVEYYEVAFGADPVESDTDGDCLTDGEEVNGSGTSPILADTDADGTPDGDVDFDGDGLLSCYEKSIGTNFLGADTDADFMSDGFEVDYGYNPLRPDSDGDGLLDWEEDGDGDGLNEYYEVVYGTDPLLALSDGDCLTDGEEVNGSGTSPTVADSDADGVSDGDEDYDSDGLASCFEKSIGTLFLGYDTDDDFLPDGFEVAYGYDPLLPDSDGDGSPDWEEDGDGDGLVEHFEHVFGTDPVVADTDGDGLSDGVEFNSLLTSPTDPDSDDDGLVDGAEVLTWTTNPLDPDSDDNGIEDGPQVHGGIVLADFVISELVPGGTWRITWAGRTPGQHVVVGLSTKGIGTGPCPAVLGGDCLDLRPDVTVVGQSSVGGSGIVTWVGVLPPNLPPRAAGQGAAFNAPPPLRASSFDTLSDPYLRLTGPVSCPDVFDPVCAADGVTYTSVCEAEAQGWPALYWGLCPS